MRLRFSLFLVAVLAVANSSYATPDDFMVCRLTSPTLKLSDDRQAMVETILAKLSTRTKILSEAPLPTLAISRSSLPTATISSSDNKLTISEGLLELTNGDSEVAFVLAHEISHKLLGHQHPLNFLGTSDSKGEEFEADQLAVALLSATGFDPSSAPALLARLAQKYQPVHPNLALELSLRRRYLRNRL